MDIGLHTLVGRIWIYV